MIDLEIRRAVDWVRIDRAEHWKHEIRRSGEAVNRERRSASLHQLQEHGQLHAIVRRRTQSASDGPRSGCASPSKKPRPCANGPVPCSTSSTNMPAASSNSTRPWMATSRKRWPLSAGSSTRWTDTYHDRPAAVGRSRQSPGPGSLNEPEAAVSEASMARPLDETAARRPREATRA